VRYVDRPDPVDESMVCLSGDGPAVALEAGDEPGLPQRPAAVESLGPVAGGPVQEVSLAAGKGQPHLLHVRVDVEVRIGDPCGPAQTARVRLGQPTAVARQRVDPAL
jgi:hypothetical protein